MLRMIHRVIGMGVVASIALSVSTPAFGQVQPTIHELTPDFTWGYRQGVKQPLGAFKNGLSLHQLSRAIGDPPSGPLGIPDYILWVDEKTGDFGYYEEPTGAFSEPWHNPGGQVAFGEDGTVWFTHGSHLPANPMKLFRSESPYDASSFVTMVDPLVAAPIGSTTPCLTAANDTVSFFWRSGKSSYADTTVRFRRYGVGADFELTTELEGVLGIGDDHPTLGVIGMEQLWTRYDPRHDVACVSWQWFEVDVHRFGSSPFLYTDDGGATWRRADGQVASSLPIRYSDADEILVPDDHLAGSGDTSWYPAEIGLTPEGAPWMAQPDGAPGCCWDLRFWRFGAEPGEDPQWHSTLLAGPMGFQATSYACGATRDYMVAAYADWTDRHLLQARVSSDDGRTWSDPFVIDVLPEDGPDAAGISWVNFVQPADEYDDTARFFYTYYRLSDGGSADNYRNKVRFVSFSVCAADLDHSGDVGLTDLLAVIAAWGPCRECAADVDQSGIVDFLDLLLLLSGWGPCP